MFYQNIQGLSIKLPNLKSTALPFYSFDIIVLTKTRLSSGMNISELGLECFDSFLDRIETLILVLISEMLVSL